MSNRPKTQPKEISKKSIQTIVKNPFAMMLGGLVLGGLAGSFVNPTPLKIIEALKPTIRNKDRAAIILGNLTGKKFRWTGKRFCEVKEKKKAPLTGQPETSNQ